MCDSNVNFEYVHIEFPLLFIYKKTVKSQFCGFFLKNIFSAFIDRFYNLLHNVENIGKFMNTKFIIVSEKEDHG